MGWSVAKGGNCRSGCDYRRPQRSAEPEDEIARHAVARGGTTERAATTTFRDVFAVAEFRALLAAQLLSVIGDQLARVALTVLVYDRTAAALCDAAGGWAGGGAATGCSATPPPWVHGAWPCAPGAVLAPPRPRPPRPPPAAAPMDPSGVDGNAPGAGIVFPRPALRTP